LSSQAEALSPVGLWLAHLTPAAVAELHLAAGTPVWLVAKTHSWRVVAG
jgi:hypothetical protein